VGLELRRAAGKLRKQMDSEMDQRLKLMSASEESA
jgi:hypothetical protein